MTAEQPLLTVSDLRFSYHHGREILKGVSLELNAGDIMCLLGSNGTGKTTLLRCILAFQRQSAGEVLLSGKSITSMKPAQRAHTVAYVPQTTQISFPYTAREVVLMGRVSHVAPGASHSKKDMDAAMAAMERLQIAHLAQCKYQEMSGGERQMVLVARALAQDAKLLIMDEPTSNLDYHNQVKILAAIKYLSENGYGILMTSHYPDHAFLACSRVALMKGGLITACGSPDDVVTSETLTELYDTPVHVGHTALNGLNIKTCIPILDTSLFAESTN